jgi:hypothetical protein
MCCRWGNATRARTRPTGIERDNARQRHWLARFRRRSIVVSKTKRMVDVSLALFARFAGNDRISDLISMLPKTLVLPLCLSFRCV